MLVAEKAIGLSWVSVRDRLPFDGHEWALICRNPNSNDLKRAIGCVGYMELGNSGSYISELRCPCVVETSFNSFQCMRACAVER